MSRTVLILGATSAIAEQTARCFAAEGDRILLGARDPRRLETIADDLRVRGAEAVTVLHAMDAEQPETLGRIIQQALDEAKQIDIALIAHGLLPDQERCELDPGAAEQALQVNFNSVVALCTPLANAMAEQGSGVIGVIGSVAGLRGRQSNYLYGAAKAGTDVFLQGLRNRLFPHGVRVLTILPGFVDTPMTAHLPKGPLFASSEAVGARLHKALSAGKPDVLYVSWFWRWIMLIIRLIPETVFKRMKL